MDRNECKRIDNTVFQMIKANEDIEVYLVDYSDRYYNYLIEKQQWINRRISGIITETSDRTAGDITKGTEYKELEDRRVPIYSYDYILKLDENAYFIVLNDYYNEIFLKLKKTDEDNNQHHSNIFFSPDYETEIQLGYREKLKDSPLENIIVFRSGPHALQHVRGMDFDDNARAVFEYMVERGFDKNWRLVWLVHDPNEYKNMYVEHPNIEFIHEGWSVSDKKEELDYYYNVLFLAKYLFCTDAYGFMRNCRDEQVRVQLWHGCGYKTRINFVRCEHRYEYIIVIGKTYKEIFKNIFGLRDDQVLITGYPKEDWLYSPCEEWKTIFNIPKASKYIFWMPTFRHATGVLGELDEKGFDGDTGLPIIKTNEQVEKINQLLKELNIVLVLKLHPMQDRSKIRFPVDSNICIIENEKLVDNHIPINRLLGNADALISDYSSTSMDYLILDRPQAFTLEDMEEYENSRGFVFDNVREWFSGKEIWSFDDFVDFICNIGNGTDPDMEKRRLICDRIHDLDGGSSCERLIKMLGIEG